MLQRCSRPLCSSQDTGGTAKGPRWPALARGRVVRGNGGPRGFERFARSLRTQQCARNARLSVSRFHSSKLEVLTRLRGRSRPTSRRSTSEHSPPQDVRLRNDELEAERCSTSVLLLRKEVIQPHLPVRLPCYDFVPIASPTFDGSLHKGWATGFGCCRLS